MNSLLYFKRIGTFFDGYNARQKTAPQAAYRVSLLVKRKAFRTQRHALIQLYTVSDCACFSDDNARAVVYKKAFTDGGTRKDHSGFRSRLH